MSAFSASVLWIGLVAGSPQVTQLGSPAGICIYLSPNGDDSASGRTAADAWRTLDRLNLAMPALGPGDCILFERGGLFRGHLAITASGAAGAPITFRPYGVGDAPVLSGALPVEGWISAGPDLWSADFDLPLPSIPALFEPDSPLPIARDPNPDEPDGGYLTVDEHVGHRSLTDYELPATPNWTGAEIVIRTVPWILARNQVELHAGNQVTLKAPGTFVYPIQDGYGFFFQNHAAALDREGEWILDASAGRFTVFRSAGPPAPGSMEAAFEEHVVSISNQSWILLEGLELRGSQAALLQAQNTSDLRIQGCRLSESASDGIVSSAGTRIELVDSLIADCPNNGVVFEQASDCNLSRNEIRDIGVRAGMGQGPDGNYFACVVNGDGNNIIGNRLDRLGYVGIRVAGSFVRVERNRVSNFCLVKDDGGGIYTYNAGQPPFVDLRIAHNHVSDGIGAPEGTIRTFEGSVQGIYLDDNTSGVHVDHNFVSDCAQAGIFVHNAWNSSITRNVSFANGLDQLHIQNDDLDVDVRALVVTDNVFCARREDQLCAEWASLWQDVEQFGVFKRNVYAHPFRTQSYLLVSQGLAGPAEERNWIGLAEWQAGFGSDLDSAAGPRTWPAEESYQLIGPNRIQNSHFDAGVEEWGCLLYTNGSGACSLNWLPNGPLDQGTLQLTSLNAQAGDVVCTTTEVGALEAGKFYFLRSQALGVQQGAALAYELFSLDNFEFFPASYTEQNLSLSPRTLAQGFFATRSATRTRLDFCMDVQAATLMLDDVEFFEAEPDEAAIDERVRRVSNPSDSVLAVPVWIDSVDPHGRVFPAGSVLRLAPWSAAVLFRD